MELQHNKIHIAGQDFHITLVNAPNVDSFGQYCGAGSVGAGEILASTMMADGRPRAQAAVEQTIWHEIIHQIDEIWGCKLDERVIDNIAYGVHQVAAQLGWNFTKD